MKIVILGPQGSGKGTQADLLAQKKGLIHISLGDVLRDEVKRHGPYADIVKKAMDEGKLVPREINNKILENVLKRYPDNFILDGYPRNERQATFLLNLTDVDKVIALNISDEVAINRISKRLICTSNHKVFIEDKITAKDIHDCTASGGEIVKRDDDKPENVLNRLSLYHKENDLVLKVFKDKKVDIIHVDASSDIDSVFEDILKKLK
ncbi:MAG: adenylate kinase family protein [Candidatus Woesearchaeota archaeon]